MNGFSIKYIGDAKMAVFRSVRTGRRRGRAVELRDMHAMLKFNGPDWLRGNKPVGSGIGISTGEYFPEHRVRTAWPTPERR